MMNVTDKQSEVLRALIGLENRKKGIVRLFLSREQLESRVFTKDGKDRKTELFPFYCGSSIGSQP